MEKVWWVVGTASEERLILVECSRTRSCGVVRDFTEEDWARASQSGAAPFQWTDGATVNVVIIGNER